MENKLTVERLIQLEEMLRTQQAELAAMREALARKHPIKPAPVVVPVPAALSPVPDRPQPSNNTSRRKVLKRVGLVVMAGGTALGITSANYTPAQARISVNPSSNVGAVITRNGATISNIPTADFQYGLIASPDDSYDANSDGGILNGYSSGISGVTSIPSPATIGVYGFSANGFGVRGQTYGGVGVFGISHNGTGLVGQTFSTDYPAVLAQNSSTTGTALQIYSGGLSVGGAGVGTNTCAFIHQTTAANISTTFNYASLIDNPYSNGRQGALLFVTHNTNPRFTNTTMAEPKPFGVFYFETINNASINKWAIVLEDHSPMPAGLYFNVLIINP